MPSYRSAAGTVVVLVAVTIAFAVLPWGDVTMSSGPLVAVFFTAGLVGTAALVFSQAWAYRQAAGTGTARLRGLLVAVYIAVLFFSTVFYLLERSQPGQFAELETRVDAVYFALTVLSTVGFGDVHAVGQTARVLVSAQIVFNLLVISLAVGAVRDAARPRPKAAGEEVQQPGGVTPT